MKTKPTLLLVLLLGLGLHHLASAQSTTFTYQGQLSDGAAPANGSYDLRFTVRDAPSAGNQVGPTLTAAPVTVADGRFAVGLDFGGGIFTGAPRWLEISVRTNGSTAAYTTLAPRQPITATPYALQALTASNVIGAISDSQLSPNIARLSSNPTFVGTVHFSPVFGPPFGVNSTNKVTQLNADLLDGFHSSAFAPSTHSHSAAELTSGALADARLSANVALLSKAQSFTASNTFTGVLAATNATNTIAGTFSGNGGGMTNLNATNLVGVIPAASLPASAAQLGANQVFSGAVTFSPATGAPFRVGGATLVTNLNADLLDGVHAAAFWNTSGNRNPYGTNFIGTLDASALELRVDNTRALRLTPGATFGPTLVVGSPANAAAVTAEGATVAGGSGNSVLSSGAFVGGGFGNLASGSGAFVGGGANNSATNNDAMVPGGIFNLAGGQYSFAAGRGARALGDGAFVWADASSAASFDSTAANQFLIRAAGGVGIGTNAPAAQLHVVGTVQADGFRLTTSPSAGALLTADALGNAVWVPPAVRVQTNLTSPNTIGGSAANGVTSGVVGATIGGGGNLSGSNAITAGNYATIAGGLSNRLNGNFTTIAGGVGNSVSGSFGTIAGGLANRVTVDYSGIGGGFSNMVSGSNSFVAGGVSNRITGTYAFIGGGEANRVSGDWAVVGGGARNSAEGDWASLGAGNLNRVLGTNAVLAGGYANTNTGYAAALGGGSLNLVTNSYAVVPGGQGNVAGGSYSLAAGQNARALHNGSFVWADYSSATPFASSAANQFLIRAVGGVGIGAAPSDAMLDVEGHVRINGNELFLRSYNRNDGLGWFGGTKAFGAYAPDGPVLFGNSGGALGTTYGGSNVILSWNYGQQVGIGTTTPQQQLSIQGGMNLDQGNRNDGTITHALRFGSSSGEGISSKRTAGGNQYGLDFYTGSRVQMSISPDGNLGIGTTTPREKLEIAGALPAITLSNSSAPAVVGYLQNAYSTMMLGFINTSSSSQGQLAAGARGAFLGFTDDGLVGSMNCTFNTPVFRNLLDYGNGNALIQGRLSIQGGITVAGDTAITGDAAISDKDIFLRGNSDKNHGLGWYSSSKPFGTSAPDGPILYGWNGGALAITYNSQKRIALAWDNYQRVGIGGRTPASRALEVEGDASKTTAGSWVANSDRRIKTDVLTVTNALDQVARVRLVSFHYSDEYRAQHPSIENRPYLNVIAQEFQEVFPEYVRGSGEKLSNGEEILQVDTYPLTIYSAAAIQELRQDVQQKEARIEQLEQQNTALADRLAALEKMVRDLAAGTKQ